VKLLNAFANDFADCEKPGRIAGVSGDLDEEEARDRLAEHRPISASRWREAASARLG
jgi:hypothetical protein